jgi:hypothetical protein
MLRDGFQQVRRVDWIDPEDLQAGADFLRLAEDRAKPDGIPLIRAKPKESPVGEAGEYRERVADQERSVSCQASQAGWQGIRRRTQIVEFGSPSE